MQVRNGQEAGQETLRWRIFLSRTTLFLGIVLLGAAVICAVAANWQALSFFQRLAGVQTLLAVCALAAAGTWLSRRQAQGARQNIPPALLCLAALVAGALLALLGQHYQTGADPYTLFALWALVTLPWALAARSRALWVLWVIVLNTAAVFWLAEMGGPAWAGIPLPGTSDLPMLTSSSGAALGLFNALLLAIWEIVTRRAGAAADSAAGAADYRVGQRVLAFIVVLDTSLAVLYSDGADRLSYLPPEAVWAVVTVALGFYYSVRRVDRVILALLCLGIMAVSLRWLGGSMLHMNADVGVSAFFVLPAMLLVEAAIAAKWLMWVGREASRVSEGAPEQTPGASSGPVPVAPGPYSAGTAAEDAAGADLPAGGPALPAAGTSPDVSAVQMAAVGSDEAPWYVQTMLGIAAWIATALLLVCLLLVKAAQTPEGAIALSLVLCAVAVAIVRAGAGIFWRQVAAAVGFAGLLLAVFGMFEVLGTRLGGICTLVLVAAVYIGAPDRLLRFLAAGIGAFALAILLWFGQRGVHAGDVFDFWISNTPRTPWNLWLPTAVIDAAVAVAAFAWGPRIARLRPDALLPLAWAFALSAQGVVWRTGGVEASALPSLWQLSPPAAIMLALAVCVPVAAAVCVLYPRRAALPATLVWGVPAALLLLALFWLPAPGIALALAWMLLGFGLQRIALLGFGVFTLLIYLFSYYYELHVPLLDKALWLLGAALLLGAMRLGVWLVPHLRARGKPVALRTFAPPTRWEKIRVAVVAAGLVLILAVVNVAAWQRERILASGHAVLLALVPVDPRSLMQGDFMALRFDIAQQVLDKNGNADGHDATDDQGNDGNEDGYAMLVLDADGVATVSRLQAAATPHQPDEIPLRYRMRGGRMRLVTNAFFFPEGQAQHYAAARFAEIRISDDGTGLLAGVRDADRNPL